MIYYTLKRIGNAEKVPSCKSKGLWAKNLTAPTSCDNILSPSIKWYGDSNFCSVFKESCLKQKKATFSPPNRINIFTVYQLDTWSQDLNSIFTLKRCLFGGVKLAKNADRDKYLYSGYGIGFDSRSENSSLEGSVGKNVIIFGVDISSSVHIGNEKKDILILDIGPTQALDDATLKGEAKYSINFSRSNKKVWFNPEL